MKKILLISFFAILGLTLNAQPNTDSLYKVWKNTELADSVRGKIMTQLIGTFGMKGQFDSVHKYSDEFYTVSKNDNYQDGVAKSLSFKGFAYQMQSNYDKAIEYYKKAITAYEGINDNTGLSWCTQSLATIYSIQGDNNKAIAYYEKSLKYSEKSPDLMTKASIFMHIARIYQSQNELELAKDYLEKALQIGLTINNPLLLTNCYGALSSIYQALGDHSKADEYIQKGQALAIINGDIPSQIQFLGAAGVSYSANEMYDKAKNSLLELIKLAADYNDELNLTKGKISLGKVYSKLNNHNSAIKLCKEGLVLAEKSKNIETQKDGCECLYTTYDAIGNSKEALRYHVKMTALDDSLNEVETAKTLQKMEFDKQVLADSLATAEATHLAEQAHQEEIRQNNQTRNLLAAGGLLVLILAGGIYGRLKYIKKSKAVLQIEKDRSESLLLNILPAEIAEELKTKGKADARDFDMVSILFTDFKSFTETSELLTAKELVEEINICFGAFDSICDKYKIEKIKTIGDSYMAAGGLPVPSDDNINNTILAALEMQEFVAKRKVELDAKDDPSFEMRVGIHTGPVVAGIVGVKKFQYDIWGDTVNTASRMESSGKVEKVNISQATYELL